LAVAWGRSTYFRSCRVASTRLAAEVSRDLAITASEQFGTGVTEWRTLAAPSVSKVTAAAAGAGVAIGRLIS